MRVRKYGVLNTLKCDAWTMAYFNVLPAIEVHYEKNSFMQQKGEEYHKELSISFQFLCFYWTIAFAWDFHEGLNS
jgi:hypothetical protein